MGARFTFTASSLSSSFLAIVSTNVSFSLSISLTFVINIFFIFFDILLPHSTFEFSHCILIMIFSVYLVLYLSSWKLLLILNFFTASYFILDIFSSFFPSVGLQFSSSPFNVLFCFSSDSIFLF